MNKDAFKIPIALISLPAAVMTFLLPLYCMELGMNAMEISGLFSAASLFVLLARPVFGQLSDRVGRKPLLLSAIVLYATANALFSGANSMLWIYGARMVQAFASALFSVSIYAMIADQAQDNVAQKMGGITSAGSYGNLVGIAVSFVLLNGVSFEIGWSRFFWVSAFAAAAAAVFSFIKIAETKPKASRNEKLKIHLSGGAIRLLAFKFVSSAFTSLISAILLIYLNEAFTDDLWKLAIAFIPPLLLSGLFAGALGKLSDRYSFSRTVVAGLMIAAVSLLCVLWTNSLYVVSGLWCAFYAGMIMFSTANDAAFAKETQDSVRGSAFGVYTAASSVGGVIGPIIGGLAYQSLAKTAPFAICGFAFMLLALTCRFFFKPTKKAA